MRKVHPALTPRIGEAFEPVGIDRFAECLRADQWPLVKLPPALLVARQDLGL
jgi:hypothetical protein